MVIRGRGAKMPRIRHPPIKLDEGTEPNHFSAPIDLYREIDYQVPDSAAEQIAKRFEQPNFANLARLENSLLDATSGQTINNNLHVVYQLFNGDGDNCCLRNQLLMQHDLCRQTPNETLFVDSIKDALDTLGKGCDLFSEVIISMTIYHVFPVSSATAARSISSMTTQLYYYDNYAIVPLGPIPFLPYDRLGYILYVHRL